MADEQVQDTTDDKVQDTPPTPDVQDTKGDDGNGKDNLTAEEYKAMLDKATKDRSAANKAEIAAKKERDALAAKVKKYEDEKKTEAEKLEARAKEAEEKAAAAEEKATSLQYRSNAQDAGVLPQYRDYAVSEFKKSSEEDPAEFFKKFKEDHPAMFNGKPPASHTAGGGPNAPSQPPDEVTKAITELEEKLKSPHLERRMRLPLTKRLRQLKEQKGANK